jgi:hypothetical protein
MSVEISVFLVGNDQILEVSDLRDVEQDVTIDAATVTATLCQADGTTDVTGQPWPLTFTAQG